MGRPRSLNGPDRGAAVYLLNAMLPPLLTSLTIIAVTAPAPAPAPLAETIPGRRSPAPL